MNGPFDALTALKIAVHAQAAGVKDADSYYLFVSLGQPMTIDNRSLLRATILMTLGKFEPVRT